MSWIAFSAFIFFAHAEEPVPAAVPVAIPVVAPSVANGMTSTTTSATPPSEEGEYEIDYEEEPGDGENDSEMPEATKSAHKKTTVSNPNGGSGGIQGSRAKHRFVPILKSETKSVYQKDGKALDVDSD